MELVGIDHPLQLPSEAVLFEYMLGFAGIPYVYGGSNPVEGLDCSGLALVYLEAAGKWPHGQRVNAQEIHDHFLPAARWFDKRPPPVAQAEFGDLVFFGKSEHEVDHIGIVLNQALMLEAGGGDATTTTREAAAKRNAFVKVMPMRYRRDYLVVLRP